jgi:hypothetical protein
LTALLTLDRQFLSLFSKAKDPDSQSHAEVTAYIQKRLAQNNGRITKEPRRKPAPPPKPPPPPPFLVTKTDEDGLETYERNFPPTPFEKLKDGKRHIPRLFVTSYNMGFLRMKKPQPYLLSKSIRSVSARLQKQITRLIELQDEDMVLAKEEDQWDRMMQRLAEEAAPVFRREDARARDDLLDESKTHFSESVFVGLRHLSKDIRRQRINSIARVQALTRIVEEEKRLAREEAPRRRALAEKALAERAVATKAPAVKAPATEEPATKAPAEKVPVGKVPVVKVAVNKTSATKAPTEKAPVEKPALAENAVGRKAPATKAPATKAPATKAPATKAPATKAPATKAPAMKAPAEKTPTERAPAEKALANKTPVAKTLAEKPKKQTRPKKRPPAA